MLNGYSCCGLNWLLGRCMLYTTHLAFQQLHHLNYLSIKAEGHGWQSLLGNVRLAAVNPNGTKGIPVVRKVGIKVHPQQSLYSTHLQ